MFTLKSKMHVFPFICGAIDPSRLLLWELWTLGDVRLGKFCSHSLLKGAMCKNWPTVAYIQNKTNRGQYITRITASCC